MEKSRISQLIIIYAIFIAVNIKAQRMVYPNPKNSWAGLRRPS